MTIEDELRNNSWDNGEYSSRLLELDGALETIKKWKLDLAKRLEGVFVGNTLARIEDLDDIIAELRK